MTYDELTTAMGLWAQQVAPNQGADYLAAVPFMIEDAELRVLRDMGELLASYGENTTLAFSANDQNFSFTGMPTQLTPPIVFQGAPLAYPNPVTVYRIDVQIAAAPPDSAAWQPLLRVSTDFLRSYWTKPAVTGIPVYWALLDDQSAQIAPTPASAYPARIAGVWRPAAMSADNQTSYIGSVYPDLLFASCRIETASFQQNFGSLSDNPQVAVSWMQVYHELLTTARSEEARRRGIAPPQAAPQPMPAQAQG